jgi:hypothetical protein
MPPAPAACTTRRRQELAAAVAAEGLRPMLPRSCPPGWGRLMGTCWARDPSQRPSLGHMQAALAAMLREELPAWEAQQRGGASGVQVQGGSGEEGGPEAMACGSGDCTPAGAGQARGGGGAQDPERSQLSGAGAGDAGEGTGGAARTAAASAPAAAPGPCSWARRAGLEELGLGPGPGHPPGPLAGGDDGGAPPYRPVVCAGSHEAIGPRDSMEDVVLAVHGFGG